MNRKEINKAKKLLEPYVDRWQLMSVANSQLCLSVEFRGGGNGIFYSLDTVEDWVEAKKLIAPVFDLTVTDSDFSELFYAFKNRGNSETKRKVAAILRKLDEKNNRPANSHWYYEDFSDDR